MARQAYKRIRVDVTVLAHGDYEWESLEELARSMVHGDNTGEYRVRSERPCDEDMVYKESVRMGSDPCFMLGSAMEGDLLFCEGEAVDGMLVAMKAWLHALDDGFPGTKPDSIAYHGLDGPQKSAAANHGYARLVDGRLFLLDKGCGLLELWLERGIGLSDFHDGKYTGPRVLAHMLPEEVRP